MNINDFCIFVSALTLNEAKNYLSKEKLKDINFMDLISES